MEKGRMLAFPVFSMCEGAAINGNLMDQVR